MLKTFTPVWTALAIGYLIICIALTTKVTVYNFGEAAVEEAVDQLLRP